MLESLSLLQRVTKADVRNEPYPHLVLEDALPAGLYERLARELPPPSVLHVDEAQNNTRWIYGANQVRDNPAITPLWKAFIAYHTSDAFFRDVVGLFYESIHTLYPRRFPTLDHCSGMTVGTRRIDTFETKEVLLDAQIDGNTPVTTANSVRTSHVDSGAKLFSGLFYMRHDEDCAVGGDLTIGRFKPGYSIERKLGSFTGSQVDDGHVETARTIRYAKNCLVLFINSLESLHGVTVRNPTRQVRRFVNLVGEVNPPLYRLPKNGERPSYVDTLPAVSGVTSQVTSPAAG